MLFPSEATRSSSQAAFVFEHVLGTRVDRPVVTLARLPTFLRQLFKTLVEAQVMTNGIFPSVVLAVKERISVGGEIIQFSFADGLRVSFLRNSEITQTHFDWRYL